MADNSTAAAGPTVATDDIGGIHYQRTKMVWGADGSATDTSTAAPLPVSIAGDAAGTIVNTPAVVTVPVTEVQILAAGTYRAIVLENLGTDHIYIGATGLTLTSYFKRLAPGEVLALTPPFVPTNAIYAEVSAGTQPLAVGVIT